MRRVNLPQQLLCNFYRSTVESILTSCITVWYGSATSAERKALQRVVQTAQHITASILPLIQDIYDKRRLRRAVNISSESPHPSHPLFQPLPSGKRTRLHRYQNTTTPLPEHDYTTTRTRLHRYQNTTTPLPEHDYTTTRTRLHRYQNTTTPLPEHDYTTKDSYQNTTTPLWSTVALREPVEERRPGAKVPGEERGSAELRTFMPTLRTPTGPPQSRYDSQHCRDTDVVVVCPEMLVKAFTGRVLIASFLLLVLGAIMYNFYKPTMEWLPYPGQTKDDVCTVACLDSLKVDNQALKDCPAEIQKDQENTAVKQAGPENDHNAEILILVWIWPFGARFPVDTCEPKFGIRNCRITDDRSQYENAHGVLFHVRDIDKEIPTLQKLPRFPLQMWVWMNSESPGYSPRLEGADDLFNLTSNYRRDSDIWTPYGWIMKANEEERAFQIPKKDKLVCWIVTHWNDQFKRVIYFNEFSKHIEVDGFGQHFGRQVSNDDYFKIIASCKFYLSFENSIYKDYISEKVYNPLVLGTVPVVIGPPRDNYEEFLPRNAFIHIDDFKTPKDLAEHLKLVDKNPEMYERYFDWRKHFVAKLGDPEEHACRTCEYIRVNRNFRVFKNVNKWYFEN
ncbi:hypothetical protein NFI96_030548 [Prochilodus magdalenae]|nr:hypothetical protein NFI96_030548 [Prochilodus magdalenae]